jgi:hypothetical protein
MSADERIAAIREKVTRAKKHLADLIAIRNTFIGQAEPDMIKVYTDPETGNEITKITKIVAPPPDIALIAGDAIHNLRSALDHLAYQLVFVKTKKKPPSSIYYPIFADAKSYETGKIGKVKGMSKEAEDLIDASKPYLGGTDELYWLHTLDIADKHHALVVTVVAVAGAWVISPARWFRPDHKTCYTLHNIRTPLNVGDIVLIREPNCEDKVDLSFDVGFGEPEIVKGQPIPKLLDDISNLIDGLIVSFRQYLV